MVNGMEFVTDCVRVCVYACELLSVIRHDSKVLKERKVKSCKEGSGDEKRDILCGWDSVRSTDWERNNNGHGGKKGKEKHRHQSYRG